MTQALVPPYPYFGSKRAVAHLIWEALGDPQVYIEPFFGSGSILLARPHAPKVETVNDLDGYLTNFWRALQHDPEGVAQWADYPVSELDLHARHRWLMAQEDFREHMRMDPDYYDVKLAGWWVWGLCCWIGHGWCSMTDPNNRRKKPQLHHHGHGIHQHRPLVGGNAPGSGDHRPLLVGAGDREGHGVCSTQTRKRPDLHHHGQGICAQQGGNLRPWFTALATRLHRVRICCGDWQRVLTPVVLEGAGITGIVLDPPYSHQQRARRLYSEDTDVAAAVAAWARHHGANAPSRIVLCGYEGDYDLPGWTKVPWQANGGYGNQGNGRGKANRTREVLWLSPSCMPPPQLSLALGATS